LTWSTAGLRRAWAISALDLHWIKAAAGDGTVRACGRNAASQANVRGARGEENPMKNILLAGTMLVLCASLIAGSRTAAAPQSGSGVVTGVVLGADNKPVPNAVVTYQNAGGRAPHVARADAHGHFTVSKLKGDVYEFRATGKGVSSDWENVAVHPGKTRNVALHAIHEKEDPKQYTATHTYEQQN
jgi:hypothetical protein